VLAGTGAVLGAGAPEPGAATEWRQWGGTAGGVRFSALRQIDRGNVAPLEPETGKEAWSFDPQSGKAVHEFNAHRGVAYWEAAKSDGGACERRILSGTVDGRLFALDALTGKPCADFGTAGAVDLREELHGRWPQDPSWGTLRITAPPVVYRDLVITAVAQQEFPGRGPYGDVRAFDVRTGREAWRFPTVPRPGEAGHETWDGESWKDRMGVKVWSIMSVDVDRGMVFLPIGSPAADFYGGDRKGMNRLPANAHANPMTFAGRDGRQYVVIAAGGAASRGS